TPMSSWCTAKTGTAKAKTAKATSRVLCSMICTAAPPACPHQHLASARRFRLALARRFHLALARRQARLLLRERHREVNRDPTRARAESNREYISPTNHLLVSGSVFSTLPGAPSCLRSHATFFGITRPPFTSARVLDSFESNTPTSAGIATKNPKKLATPLCLNAAFRTVSAVSSRRAFAIRESRPGTAESGDDKSGYGKGAGVGKIDDSEMVRAGTCAGVSYG